jgi:hypothetical protein
MEIFSEEQNPPDGREGDRESELPLEESTSHSSGPSEMAALMMDEPSSGIPSEVAKISSRSRKIWRTWIF